MGTGIVPLLFRASNSAAGSSGSRGFKENMSIFKCRGLRVALLALLS